jgi:hypothetical protein
MGLEQRKGKINYYKKRRIGSRVVSEYVGGGLLAVVAHKHAQERKEEGRVKAQETERQRAETLNLEAEIDTLIGNINALSAGILTASGFYQHNRQWRVRGNGNNGKHRNQAKGKRDQPE